MAVDYNQPTNATVYTTVLAQLRENIVAALKLTGRGANVPNGAIRWNDATNRFEQRVNNVWVALRTLAQTVAMKVADSNKLNGQNAAYYRNAGNINAGTLPAARLPNHSAAKITTGTLPAARVGNLPAGKVTTGAFDSARIPPLPAAKIATGTLDAARIPDTLAVRGVNQLAFQTVDADAATGRAINGVAMAVNVAGRTATVTMTLTRVAA